MTLDFDLLMATAVLVMTCESGDSRPNKLNFATEFLKGSNSNLTA